jgi:hypothetical protein
MLNALVTGINKPWGGEFVKWVKPLKNRRGIWNGSRGEVRDLRDTEW